VQEVTLALDHVSVEVPPDFTLLGEATRLTVGVLPATVRVADWVADPPGPVQVNSYSVLLVTVPVDCIPPVGTLPCHPPEAVQPVDPVELQTRLAASPLLTVAGPTLSLTVGAHATFTATV
jgi:hypothetical protein